LKGARRTEGETEEREKKREREKERTREGKGFILFQDSDSHKDVKFCVMKTIEKKIYRIFWTIVTIF